MARPHDPRIADQLLNRIADSVLKRGITGLTLRPLASDLGVSARTLNYHFGGKEQLLLEAIRRLRQRQPEIARVLSTESEHYTDAAQAMTATVKRLWKEARQPQIQPFLALYFELATLAIRDPSHYRELFRVLERDWADAITQNLSKLGVPQSTAKAAASAALAGYRGALFLALATGDWEAGDEAVAFLVDALERQLS